MKLSFEGTRILVLGDPMLDQYWFGHVDRFSPEAPVPIFIKDSMGLKQGGAANVAAQLKELRCEVHQGWSQDAIVTLKERYMVGSHHLLRIDYDRLVTNTLPNDLGGFQAIVISDYAKGACTPDLCSQAIRSGIPVIVDPKGKDWTKYQGFRLICPNQYEVNGNEGFDVVEKLGARGIRYRGEIYPSRARHVYDVTGAGDTVVAVLALCVASGIDIPTGCKLANAAAGYVVGEIGTTVCPLEYLCAYAETL